MQNSIKFLGSFILLLLVCAACKKESLVPPPSSETGNAFYFGIKKFSTQNAFLFTLGQDSIRQYRDIYLTNKDSSLFKNQDQRDLNYVYFSVVNQKGSPELELGSYTYDFNNSKDFFEIREFRMVGNFNILYSEDTTFVGSNGVDSDQIKTLLDSMKLNISKINDNYVLEYNAYWGNQEIGGRFAGNLELK